MKKNTVQETLIIPLYARKLCTEQYPNVFQDTKAVELIHQLDYDFTTLESKQKSSMHRFGALEVAMRQTDIAIEIKKYVKQYPMASIVNLGCGLDQTAENCDNGMCRIYNLDFEDVIKTRNELLPPTDRIVNLAVDLNDTSWFDFIEKENGVVFFASGVFYYFTQTQVQNLFTKMKQAFPNGKLIFDTAGKQAVKLMIKTWVKQAGITDVDAYFHVGNIKEMEWIQSKVSSKGYMLGYNDLKDPSISSFFRFLSWLADHVMKMKIVCIEF